MRQPLFRAAGMLLRSFRLLSDEGRLNRAAVKRGEENLFDVKAADAKSD
jgi:hypothetical protein